MSKHREPFYDPPANGDAMRHAREVTGLEEEIALLRVMLREYVAKEQPDEGLILSTVNTLGRALLAQTRIKGVDAEAAGDRAAAAIRRLGALLGEE